MNINPIRSTSKPFEKKESVTKTTKIASLMSNPMTYEDLMKFKYIRNIDNYLDFFGSEIVKKALKDLEVEVKDFATHIFIAEEYNQKPYEKYLKDPQYKIQGYTKKYMTYKQELYETTISTCGYQYIIPDDYQCNEDKFFRYCLEVKYPFLKMFYFNCYHFDQPGTWLKVKEKNDAYEKEHHQKSCGYGCEIYIYTSSTKKSLYVPLVALDQKDPSFIDKRMKEYYEWYYKDKEDKYYDAILPLSSQEYIQLCKLIEDIPEVDVYNI